MVILSQFGWFLGRLEGSLATQIAGGKSTPGEECLGIAQSDMKYRYSIVANIQVCVRIGNTSSNEFGR